MDNKNYEELESFYGFDIAEANNDFENTDDYNDGEIINLTPDMSRVWGQVLRGLRESGETILHAACIDLADVEYLRDTIEITCKDDALYALLVKHKNKLEQFSGKGSLNIYRGKRQEVADKQTIARLETLFGDKLTIKQS